MYWRDIKDNYKNWDVDSKGFSLSPDRFRIKVGTDVRIGNDVSIGNNDSIGNYASIGNYVSIGNCTGIGNDEIITKTPLYIQGSRHQVYVNSYKNKLVGVGCKRHTIQYWLDNYKEIGKDADYTQKEIEEYLVYIKLFDEHLKMLSGVSSDILRSDE